jgi:3-oxoacyl-[acyl-carrier protein] reductase
MGEAMKLKDRVAIVTGGGRGIGRAYALRFNDEGAKVVIADIILENAQKVAEEIKAKGGDALALHTDVSSETSTIEMAKRTIEGFGRIDILMNNAAIYYGIGAKPWDGWTVEDWDRMFAVNVRGSWLCAKAVFPQMKAQGKGKIINISSSAADAGLDQILAYICSKGAVITLTRGLARALGRYNINVNCILPGFTLSEASLEMSGKGGLDEVLIRRRCLRRAEYPEDLVGTAVFLASEDSDFVTGQVISVDGGDVMR